MQGNPRQKTLQIIISLFQRGKQLRPLLFNSYRGLKHEDRALLKEIVFGVLRKKLYLEWILKGYLRRPERLKPATLYNLLISLYQLEYLNIPDYAVVNEAVKLEKRHGRNPSVVNGVLRNFLRNKTIPPLPEEPIERLSILTSHPRWLIKRWLKRFGEQKTREILELNNQEPPIVLRVNCLRSSPDRMIEQLKQEGIVTEKTPYCPIGLRVKAYEDFSSITKHIGSVYVQDEAAQLVSYLLSPEPGKRILDACAAPGGKTLHIAEITVDSAEIIAVDKNPLSVKLMKENLKTGNYKSIKIVHSDILEFKPEEPFHMALVDAPCSSLGVIRRNPDVRYRHKEKALLDFQKKQLEILFHVSELLHKGGTLLYSVCSFEPEETTEVVKIFLNKKKDSFIIDRNPVTVIPERMFTTEGFFCTVPFINEMDGFFAARFKKV